ncbi:hypothetical protein AGMMS4952_20300 [Spirochaetia bacterium]|nr:hypothetical protein AGMMS4952_20300 [Spirochaetia bacterium]
MKKYLYCALALMVVLLVSACKNGPEFVYEKSWTDVAAWKSMITPGGGEGSVVRGDSSAIIQAAPDGWGGVQSEKITLDLSQNPILLIQVRENADGFKWGAKFVPDSPAIPDHAWGFYLIEDNNFKWNNYAGTDIRLKLGQDFIDIYGEKAEGVFWIYAAGSPDATVEISSVKILNIGK